ncbi:MAG: pyruvate ferredoxin oxidoreductase [Candidatus Aenigmarchaeota archaeon]|nr:pyruvate ferredoxin oxidoreductase [Candidatus Aenigmarchaeota archaeon]
MKKIMDGNEAGAWAAKLANVQVIPNFPVTPQTELIETLAKWKVDGKFKGDFLDVESEHSVMSAAVASEATGVRTFTASSSQGLLLMHEVFYIASGMRLPIVMINVSRGLSAPITLWSDHNDILDQRDTGWMMFFTENNQEVIDLTLQAFKIAENHKVLLPCFVNLDGFILSYTREPVKIPTQKAVDKFLPKYKPVTYLDPKKPMNLGIPVMEGYMKFRLQQEAAMENALGLIKKTFKEWEKKFGRKYDVIERFMMDDAVIALVSVGAMTSTAKAAVLEARKKGIKVGLVKIVVYRPFPFKELEDALNDVVGIGVCDQNIAPGYGGIIYHDVRSLMYGYKRTINNYILGLGGKSVPKEKYVEIIEDLLESTTKVEGDKVMYIFD